MRHSLRQLEYAIAAGALTAIGALVAWWAIFARRLVAQNSQLERTLLLSTGDPLAEEKLKGIEAQAHRLSLMLVGEGAIFALALVVCVVVLVLLARDRRRAQQRMERLLQFTTHELKTPVAGVRMLLQSLGLGSVPEAMRADLITRGLNECDRLEHLVESILAWQRSMAAPELVKTTPHVARELVDGVLEHRRKSGVEQQVDLSVAPADVLADRDAFRVIVENLLDNVRKYGGGKAELVGRTEQGTWRLEVRDFGGGFPPDDAEALFDPFRRQPRQGVTHGSGLGLFLARQLAEAMGGRLSAHSSGPGAGSTFTLVLPISKQSASGRVAEVSHG